MAFTEFCCRSGGSNLNAGTRSGNSTEPGTAADFTYAVGAWNQSTNVFTPVAANPSTDGVAVGDWVSVYTGAPSYTGYIARVTAVSSTTFTLSSTAKSGSSPSTGTCTAKVGGAWAGMSGTTGFPFAVGVNANAAMTNVAGDPPRINLKNNQTYAITANFYMNGTGPGTMQGYTTAYGDGGLAAIDGGVSGSAYQLISYMYGYWTFDSIKFQNNGASGSTHGMAGYTGLIFRRCVFSGMRGAGINAASGGMLFDECEFYGNNLSNTSNYGGLVVGAGPITFKRCIIHDNTGANSNGIYYSNSSGYDCSFIECIFDTNARCAFEGTYAGLNFLGCEFYNNGSDAIKISNASTGRLEIENCNFFKNTGIAITGQSGVNRYGVIRNCGFGRGTMQNNSGSGDYTNLSQMQVIGSIIYTANETPWVDPANGDFRITNISAKGAGRSAFLQTAASYSGMTSARDAGAGQHSESIAAVKPMRHPSMRGGMNG